MATATKAEPTRQELEPKHDALLLRREGLVDLIESAPAEIAQLRELWVRSETPTSERKLQAAIRAREAAEADLVQVDANIAVVDTLLAEELAREQQKAREELAGRLGGMRDEQARRSRLAPTSSPNCLTHGGRSPRRRRRCSQPGGCRPGATAFSLGICWTPPQ
jgi:hypothetical protein